jgi:hypothetical protein
MGTSNRRKKCRQFFTRFNSKIQPILKCRQDCGVTSCQKEKRAKSKKTCLPAKKGTQRNTDIVGEAYPLFQ